ncbi:hypothetical protein BKA70DRAFT_1245239 [Coprinopsis sp. MPI-PUGE-AT-0042]|nr:hypothetical protein BKA70DRAFT_1245239 [Coprinopsis sp. MPI-PUGE-AT-0042]
MSWYSSRWRRSNSNATPLPTVAPTSPLSPTTGGAAATAGAPNGLTNPGGPQAGFAHLLPQTNAADPTGATRADRKALEPLFGPNIGAVSSGPAWTGYVDRDKKVLGGGYTGLSSTDELTPEVINGWVEKSKDPTQPTTTLQALVNLKRPSLRLVPLTTPSYASDTAHAPPQQHALEFTYDADAPKVSIRVHVYLPKGHPDLGGTFSSPTAALTASPYSPSGAAAGAATGTSTFASPATATSPSTSSSHPYAKLLVFETVTEGGFGRKLKIVDGAVVELGRFEKVPAHLKRLTEEQQQQRLQERDPSTGSEVPNIGNMHLTVGTPTEGGAAANARRSRRFTRAFRLITPHRHRDQEQELRAAGPALAVVDVNAQPEDGTAPITPALPNATGAAAATPAKKDDEHGVKLTIRLVALDEQGAEMGCPNEQVTYLHIVRVGTKPAATAPAAPKTPAVAAGATSPTDAEAATSSTSAEAPAQPSAHAAQGGEEEEEEEDTRPWVVKVVKREATIGPHTFHLHEIFGLTNSASDTSAEPAPAPVPVQGHTYPPTGGVVGNDTPDDPSPSEECLLCLSSPREVVLLPCRHLVACKDCALNMVEFGAGGAINQGNETQAAPVTTGAAGAAGGDGQDGAAAPAGGADAGGMTTNIVNAMNTRRKRKAKGWFCPVCRQPYTSLLRLTTAPPPAPATNTATVAAAAAVATAAPVDGSGVAATGDVESNAANGEGGQNNSGLLGSLRPSFFRSLTTGKGVPENAGTTAAGGPSAAAANPAVGGSSAAAAGAARTSGDTVEGESEEMVQVNARVGDVESTGGLGRVGA